jgi:hypothetical protein
LTAADPVQILAQRLFWFKANPVIQLQLLLKSVLGSFPHICIHDPRLSLNLYVSDEHRHALYEESKGSKYPFKLFVAEGVQSLAHCCKILFHKYP